MKTRIAIVTMLVGLFFTGTIMANTPVPASKTAVKEVSAFLKKELTYPCFASETNLECTVAVSLIIQEDGSLQVDAANCKSCCMRDHVIQEINTLQNEEFAIYAEQNIIINVKYNLID